MADKFIIHGAAFNGDGTSSVEATSNGGVGAWNNINIFTGTAPGYGSLNAGDVVYIRSKTSAGADITITSASQILCGSANATSGSPIHWVLDNGATWPGIDGQLILNGTAAAAQINFRTYNNFTALTKHNLIGRTTSTSSNYVVATAGWEEVVVDGLFIDCSQGAATYQAVSFGGYGKYIFNNLKIKGPSGTPSQVFEWSTNGLFVLFTNLHIELQTPVSRVFRNPGTGAYLQINGGELYGAGATTGTYLTTSVEAYGLIELRNFKYPSSVLLMDKSSINDSWPMFVRAFGGDGAFGSESCSNGVYETSRQDGFFPYLNAQLPNSLASGWSWKIEPFNVRLTRPWFLTLCKVYQEDAAIKTITTELLIATAFSGKDKLHYYINVSYVDAATGSMKYLTSREPTAIALDSSSASWSSLSYGPTALSRYKLSVTTPTAIKKDTVVSVTVSGSKKQASAFDLIFVCPDPVLT